MTPEEPINELSSVYRERNAVVIAFAKAMRHLGWDVGVEPDPEHEGWPILYVETPTGQCSWHISAQELSGSAFGPYPGEWDGHTTEQKYERLARLT